MPLTHGSRLTQFAGFLNSKLADRLQHQVARVPAVVLGNHQRFVNKLSQQGQNVLG